MSELAYCMPCKQKVKVVEGQFGYYKNGTPIERGKCSICGSKVVRMLSKAEKGQMIIKTPEGKTENA